MLTDAYAATRQELRAEINELTAQDRTANARRIRMLRSIETDLVLGIKPRRPWDEAEAVYPDVLNDNEQDGLPFDV